MYVLRCPNCSRDFDIEEDDAGRMVRCAWCEASFRAPRDEGGAGSLEVVGSGKKKRKRLKERRERGYSHGAIRLMIGGVVMLIAGAIMLAITLPMLNRGGRGAARLVGGAVVLVICGFVSLVAGIFGQRE
jgi:predicted Zn finger-like uncharacterized protein